MEVFWSFREIFERNVNKNIRKFQNSIFLLYIEEHILFINRKYLLQHLNIKLMISLTSRKHSQFQIFKFIFPL